MAKVKPSSAHDSGAPGDDELVNLLGGSHAAFQALAHGRAGVACEWKHGDKLIPAGEALRVAITAVAADGSVEIGSGEEAKKLAK